MNYYIEITLLPSHDFNLFKLWSRVFEQIHLGLVESQDEHGRVSVGLSFPGYVNGGKHGLLGSKLRLFACDEANLAKFDAPKWLSRLSDNAHCTSIRTVPDKISGYAIFQRERAKTNPERLARRYAKRHGLNFETAWNEPVKLLLPEDGDDYPTAFRYCDMQTISVGLPFVRLQSLSGGQSFCLWIAKTIVSMPISGCFSTYGLSRSATVPEF